MPVEVLGEEGERPSEQKITDIWLKVQELHTVFMKGQRIPSVPCPGRLQLLWTNSQQKQCPSPLNRHELTKPGHEAVQKGKKIFRTGEHEKLVQG